MNWLRRWMQIDTVSVPEAARELNNPGGAPPSSPGVVVALPPPALSAGPSPVRSVTLTLIDLLDYVREAKSKDERDARRTFYLDAAHLILHEPAGESATQTHAHDAQRPGIATPAWRARAAAAIRSDGLEDRDPREGGASADESPAERDEREYQQRQREEWEAKRLARMNDDARHGANPEDEAG